MTKARDAQLATQLCNGLAHLSQAEGSVSPPDLLDPLLSYLALLGKWNRVYNLTAIQDPGDMVSQHMLDSLAVLPFIKSPKVLDVGTGAGLPGIPLALARPDCEFTLLDSNAKKTRFVTQAVAELRLANVTVIQSRVEDFTPAERFTTVVSRAFASINDMLNRCGHLITADGVILAMKGRTPDQELVELQDAGLKFQLDGVYPLTVPGLDAQRHVAVLQPINPPDP